VTRGSARALPVSGRTALHSIRRRDDQPPTEGRLDPAGEAALEPGGEQPRRDAPGSWGPCTTRGGRVRRRARTGLSRRRGPPPWRSHPGRGRPVRRGPQRDRGSPACARSPPRSPRSRCSGPACVSSSSIHGLVIHQFSCGRDHRRYRAHPRVWLCRRPDRPFPPPSVGGRGPYLNMMPPWRAGGALTGRCAPGEDPSITRRSAQGGPSSRSLRSSRPVDRPALRALVAPDQINGRSIPRADQERTAVAARPADSRRQRALTRRPSTVKLGLRRTSVRVPRGNGCRASGRRGGGGSRPFCGSRTAPVRSAGWRALRRPARPRGAPAR
jgi:hypothetical protein